MKRAVIKKIVCLASIAPYNFLPPGWSLMARPTSITKLDFLKVVKEFIFNENEEVLPKGLIVYEYLIQKEFRSLMGLPEDSLTNEQKITKAKITKLVLENFYVKDSLVFELSREDFIKHGFPEEYWDICIKDIQDVNLFISRMDREEKTEVLDSLTVQKEIILEKINSLLDE